MAKNWHQKWCLFFTKQHLHIILIGMKECRLCKATKTLAEFSKHRTSSDGYRSLCTPCNTQENKKWRANNPKRHADAQAKYRQKNQSYLAAYHKKWRDENWPELKAYIASRKKRIKRQTPKWVNLNEIKEIYLKCPPGYHVDHIVPINGRLVSGLHVPWNMQYLPAIENLRKSNKF